MTGIISQRYMSCNNSTIMVRVPGCKQANFHRSRSKDAIQKRDKLCRLVGLDPYSKTPSQAGRIHIYSHADKKSDLPVGLCFSQETRTLADGSEKTYRRVVAIGHPGSQPKTKSFSVQKYGEEQAVAMAIEWRDQTQIN